jgi:transposase
MWQRANRREWSRRVGRWRRSGKTSKEFAAETGINPSTLLWWSTQLRAAGGVAQVAGARRRQNRGTAERCAPVPIVELSGGVVDDRFELELGGGRRLRNPPGFDAGALDRLLAVLR